MPTWHTQASVAGVLMFSTSPKWDELHPGTISPQVCRLRFRLDQQANRGQFSPKPSFLASMLHIAASKFWASAEALAFDDEDYSASMSAAKPRRYGQPGKVRYFDKVPLVHRKSRALSREEVDMRSVPVSTLDCLLNATCSVPTTTHMEGLNATCSVPTTTHL